MYLLFRILGASLTILLSRCSTECYRWGTYKPHLLYHYMEKDGSQFGLMYSKPGLRVPLTHKYTTKDLYSTYLLQDFKGTIHSVIRDPRADMEIDIKTINDCKGHWQTEILHKQGFVLSQSANLKTLSTELILYFYEQRPYQQIIMKQQDNFYLVSFNDSNWTYRITFDPDIEGMVNAQSIHQQSHSKWKSAEIYNKLHKTYNYTLGFDILSQDQKVKDKSSEEKFWKQFKSKQKMTLQKHNNKPQNKTCKVQQFYFDLMDICYDKEHQFDKKQQSEKSIERKPKLETKLENIGFLQILIWGRQTKITIECVNQEFSQEGATGLDFESDFERRKLDFTNKANLLFFPKDFEYLSEQLYQQSHFRGFQAPRYSLKNWTQALSDCIEQTISNVLGGIVYYRGQLDRTDDRDDEEKSVFSGSPSRSVFPRGFLWDDGFHLISICKWDMILCKEILRSWLNLIDKDGWIAREQVRIIIQYLARSEEINSQIPYQFVSQDPQEANPPTLLLPIRMILQQINQKHQETKQITSIIDQLTNYSLTPEISPEDVKQWILRQEYRDLQQKRSSMYEDIDFINEISPKLKKWRKWFQKTQVQQGTSKYRWKCKGGCELGMLMGSGMDDYPRSKEGHIIDENIDLQCWMILFDQTLSNMEVIIAETAQLDTEEIFARFRANSYQQRLSETISQLYMNALDPTDSLFKDYSRKVTSTTMEDEIASDVSDTMLEDTCSKCYQTLHENSFQKFAPISFRSEIQLVEYFLQEEKSFLYEPGYLNLFPIFFGSVASNSKSWQSILKLITDENQLWSKYGIRSLSKSSQYYGTDEDYWRGAIWMPMNYLVLRALQLYGDNTISKTLYHQLRGNLIANLFDNWEKSGYMFENYNGDTGLGQRSYPFDGWTGSTFLAICSEIYD